jgi:hypothetical protein
MSAEQRPVEDCERIHRGASFKHERDWRHYDLYLRLLRTLVVERHGESRNCSTAWRLTAPKTCYLSAGAVLAF